MRICGDDRCCYVCVVVVVCESAVTTAVVLYVCADVRFLALCLKLSRLCSAQANRPAARPLPAMQPPAAANAIVPRSRPMQDFTAWTGYGTAQFWNTIKECPDSACELMCIHLSKLGVINASEPTSRDLASQSAVASLGAQSMVVSQESAQHLFEKVKAGARMSIRTRSEAVTTACGDNRCLFFLHACRAIR